MLQRVLKIYESAARFKAETNFVKYNRKFSPMTVQPLKFIPILLLLICHDGRRTKKNKTLRRNHLSGALPEAQVFPQVRAIPQRLQQRSLTGHLNNAQRGYRHVDPVTIAAYINA